MRGQSQYSDRLLVNCRRLLSQFLSPSILGLKAEMSKLNSKLYKSKMTDKKSFEDIPGYFETKVEVIFLSFRENCPGVFQEEKLTTHFRNTFIIFLFYFAFLFLIYLSNQHLMSRPVPGVLFRRNSHQVQEIVVQQVLEAREQIG